MGTHPIFESDFDCLTEGRMSSSDESDDDQTGRNPAVQSSDDSASDSEHDEKPQDSASSDDENEKPSESPKQMDDSASDDESTKSGPSSPVAANQNDSTKKIQLLTTMMMT